MRVLLVLLVVLLSSHFLINEREVVLNRKIISVSGQTSLGGFNCDYSKKDLKDTLFFEPQSKKGDIVFDIPVQEFSCGNFLINKDFRKTIKADEYPKCRVRVANLKPGAKHYTCDLTVNLVGKRLHFPDFRLVRNTEGLKGNLMLSFEELELKAPQKLGGLVKVEEELKLQIFLGFAP